MGQERANSPMADKTIKSQQWKQTNAPATTHVGHEPTHRKSRSHAHTCTYETTSRHVVVLAVTSNVGRPHMLYCLAVDFDRLRT
eukprot:2043639-Pyramimonas_sp.AAC.1